MEELKRYINRRIYILDEGQTGYRASRAMCENNVGCVVVTNREGHIKGVLTDRDIACSMVALNLSPETPLKELMTTPPVTLDLTASLEKVVRAMEDNGVRRIPITEGIRHGLVRCIGIVTLDDLIATKRISIEMAARVIRSQLVEEAVPIRKPPPKTQLPGQPGQSKAPPDIKESEDAQRAYARYTQLQTQHFDSSSKRLDSGNPDVGDIDLGNIEKDSPPQPDDNDHWD